MRLHRRFWTGIAAGTGLLVLILDGKTAISGARDGIFLCINSVIPSLFPFFVLSTIINGVMVGSAARFMEPIGQICGIPKGSESILLLGLLGGYPVGAQCINEAYRNNKISNPDAKRMLGFCNNAGPAFIFGIAGSLFEARKTVWYLWGIHILCALITGWILPDRSRNDCMLENRHAVGITAALEKGLKNIALVCGWIIIFRVITAFFQRWFLWLFPDWLQAAIVGILELTNGCYALHNIANQGTRFVLCAGMLSLGGCCVAMQTFSVAKRVGTGMYFPGKLFQTTLSFVLASAVQFLLFPKSEIWRLPDVVLIILFCTLLIQIVVFCRRKKL